MDMPAPDSKFVLSTEKPARTTTIGRSCQHILKRRDFCGDVSLARDIYIVIKLRIAQKK